jgi:hypothetical protein
MPFKSKAQMKACFATNGFNGKIDCDEWAKDTNTKSLPDKKREEGGYNMYRPKNCKKCGGKMQLGGQQVYKTQADVDAANQIAKNLALKKGLISGEDTYVARKPGDPVVQYSNFDGTPYTAPPTKPLPMTVPAGADLQSADGTYWYTDPVTGDVVDVDPAVANTPRFRRTPEQVAADAAVRTALLNSKSMPTTMRMKGGRLQRGGQMYDQRQRDEMRDYLSTLQNQPLLDTAPPLVNDMQMPQQDRIQEGIQKGIIQTPQGYNTGQDWYASMNQLKNPPPQKQNNPYQTLQNVGLGIMGARAGLGFLSGAIERGRQNQYDYTQQTALGQMNPMQASDFQPNPYSLYAKYGGNLKTIMKDYQKWSNNAQMDFGSGDNDKGMMKKGGYEIDRMLIVRKLLPELLNLGNMNHSYKRYKQEGGDMPMNSEMGQYLPEMMQRYPAIDPLQQQIPPGFHLMPDGTLMPDDEMYKKGGIHIKKENRGKFTEYCGGKVTDDCIQKGLNSPSATIRKRANFARNARKWN